MSVGQWKPAWPTPERQRQEFGWTARVPRPVKGDCEDYLLAGRQEAWDAAEAKRKAHAGHVAERQAELKARERERREEELYLDHLAAGGTNESWASEGPNIVAADRERRTLDAADTRRSLINLRQHI